MNVCPINEKYEKKHTEKFDGIYRNNAVRTLFFFSFYLIDQPW